MPHQSRVTPKKIERPKPKFTIHPKPKVEKAVVKPAETRGANPRSK